MAIRFVDLLEYQSCRDKDLRAAVERSISDAFHPMYISMHLNTASIFVARSMSVIPQIIFFQGNCANILLESTENPGSIILHSIPMRRITGCAFHQCTGAFTIHFESFEDVEFVVSGKEKSDALANFRRTLVALIN